MLFTRCSTRCAVTDSVCRHTAMDIGASLRWWTIYQALKFYPAVFENI